jgi:hypothetical protein
MVSEWLALICVTPINVAWKTIKRLAVEGAETPERIARYCFSFERSAFRSLASLEVEASVGIPRITWSI